MSFTKRIATFATALSLFAALVATLSLLPSKKSAAATFVAPAAEAAPAANRVDISFRNERGQEIGEGRPFPLDRVSRGEQYTVIVRAQQYPICIQLRAANGYQRQWTAQKEFRLTDRVPTNPSFDNAIFTVLDLNGHKLEQRRLPIGKK